MKNYNVYVYIYEYIRYISNNKLNLLDLRSLIGVINYVAKMALN